MFLECIGCWKYLKCELQALKQYVGINQAEVLKGRPRFIEIEEDDPLFEYDPHKYVLCKRCVRACKYLRGLGILEVKEKDGVQYIFTRFDLPLAEEVCKFCGLCIEVCPTGARRDKVEINTMEDNRKKDVTSL
uniref:4Fe-4S dicluster domain-containing protein n=1 Tax=candidate division WOR-3 bacterium TaxID=2052148 RepID=A0A7C2K432_UNCW3